MLLKKPDINIAVNFEDILTSDSCAQLIMELVKYVLYQKQQIPFSYDTLAKLHSSSKENNKNSEIMAEMLFSLRTVLDQLSLQLSIDNCNVKEIAVVVGPTIFNPTLCIRFDLPSRILNSRKHTNHENTFRKSLLCLMRSVFECTEFQEFMTETLDLTNTFVLLYKNDKSTSLKSLSKLDFKPSMHNATSFRIKFNHNEDYELDCTCLNAIKIYHDSMEDNFENEDSNESQESDENKTFHWYQARHIFKGFQYIK